MESEKILEKLKEETEKKIEEVMKQGLQPNNIDMVYSLVDIHKDIANEEYWKEKGESMRYRGYSEGGQGGSYGARGRGSYNAGGQGGSGGGNYGARGRGRQRDSRGRYKESGGYQGQEMIDEMAMEYENYSEGKEQYRRGGSYGAKEDSMKALEYMLESVYCFVEMLSEEAESPEEEQMIKHYAKKISEL